MELITYIAYLFLFALLMAILWVVCKILENSKPQERQVFNILSLAYAFIKEKDDAFMTRPLTPQMQENKEWLLRHSIRTDHSGIFIFRYLEEWANMNAVLKAIDLDDLLNQLTRFRLQLFKEVKAIPMGTDAFTAKLTEIKKVEDQIEALKQLTKKRLPLPPPPPPRPEWNKPNHA